MLICFRVGRSSSLRRIINNIRLSRDRECTMSSLILFRVDKKMLIEQVSFHAPHVFFGLVQSSSFSTKISTLEIASRIARRVRSLAREIRVEVFKSRKARGLETVDTFQNHTSRCYLLQRDIQSLENSLRKRSNGRVNSPTALGKQFQECPWATLFDCCYFERNIPDALASWRRVKLASQTIENFLFNVLFQAVRGSPV